MAGRHTQPSHPPLLRSLNQEALPADGSRYYEGEAARWYSTVYAWKNDDIPFYLAQAERWAGPGGAVLELACGNGRVALPMARAGYRVAAVDTSEAMLEQLAQRLSEEPEPGPETERASSGSRQLRSGAWVADHKWARCASRNASGALNRGTATSFRVAKSLTRR